MTARDELRDEIAEFVDRVLHHGVWEESGPEVADRIMGMLRERGWVSYRSKPTPRVYFPGDTVPAGVAVMFPDRSILDPCEDEWHADDGNTPAVEIPVPSPEEWRAAVDRARVERQHVAATEETDRG